MDQTRSTQFRVPYFPRLLFVFLTLTGLFFISRSNYLLFHSFAESFSIIVAFAVFFIVWNAKNKPASPFLSIVGISFVFVGIFDLLHTLAYKGMGVFPEADADLATRLWIGARYFQSLAILAGLLLIRKRVRFFWTTTVMFTVATLFLLSVFLWDNFPVCFVEGDGLTPFKVISEYVISAVVLVSIVLLWRNRSLFERNTGRMLIGSLVMTIAAELAFTLYNDIYGILNVLGHFFKIIAFYLIYLALVESGINHPTELLYKDMVDSKNRLQSEIEERTAAEAAFRTSLDASPYPIAINNRSGVFTYANKPMLDIFGYADLEEMNRSSYRERYTPEYQKVVEQTKKKQNGGEFINDRLQHDVIRKNGEIRTVDMQINKIWWEGEEQFQVVYRDITGQKLAEQEIALRAQILDEATDGICLIDTEGTLIYLNDRCARMHGYEKEELLGTNIGNLPIHENTDIVQLISENLAASDFATFEIMLFRKDGTPMHLEVHTRRIDIGGRVFNLNVERDVTERKEAEESLRRTNLFLEGMQKLAKLGGWSYDMTSGKNYWSDFMYELYGVSKDFDIDDVDMITDYFPGEHKQILLGHFERSQKEGIPFDCELEFIDARGQHHWVRGTGEPVYQDGKIVKVEGNLQDITERKKWEEEQHRTAHLESIGTLAGGIAHDFNNILTGILGNISLARISLEDGEIDEIGARLNDAETASFRARDLTRQLLTFSKGGAPVKSILSIEDLVRESASFSTRGSSIQPVFSITEPLWPVEADEGQMMQVINNIVINAVQAMPNGGEIRLEMKNISDEVAARRNLPEKNFVMISITDQGIGIPEEHLNRVFEPYFTTKPKGSGLGLATCYSVVRNHEGLIAIESTPEAGTTVTIYIPASKGKTPETTEAPAEIPAAGSGRILIMDDEPVIRQLLLVGLTGAGYEVVETTDGNETIHRYTEAMKEQRPFDAVIMDLTVPGGLGGKETVVQLREIDPGVKAIVSSGYSNDSVLANPLEYGFSGVVTKPFVIRDVIKVLKEILS